MSYITAESTREEIYEAYIDAQNRLKASRHQLKINQDKVKEVRKDKNKKYNELRYQVLKRDQKIFAMQKHIYNLQRFAVQERHKAKKKGIEIGKNKIRKVDYSVIKMYEFLMQVHQVGNILDMKLNFCAFILWAGRYEFFSVRDFRKDFPTQKSMQYYIASFVKSGHIVKIGIENKVRKYTLTGIGIDLFNKIDKFTKKHFNEQDS